MKYNSIKCKGTVGKNSCLSPCRDGLYTYLIHIVLGDVTDSSSTSLVLNGFLHIRHAYEFSPNNVIQNGYKATTAICIKVS